MIEAVEYVVRKSLIGKRYVVWMMELDASEKPARFLTSSVCSTHNSLKAAEKSAKSFRDRDEVHIDKVLKGVL